MSAFEQVTLRRGRRATAVRLRTNGARTTELPFSCPLGSRMFFPRAEAAAARVAGEAGTAYVLSTLSGTRLEEVKAATTGPAWYQVYLVGGRDVALPALARARAAGFAAIAVTVDTAVPGLRERDVRNRVNSLVSGRLWSMLPALPGLVSHPRWLAGFLSDGGLMSFPNVELPGKGPMPYADVGVALSQSMVSWNDLGWIRDAWPGPIVIKGIHTAEDARRAVEAGADAIVVSNHGGRQLDGVAPTCVCCGGGCRGRDDRDNDGGGIRRLAATPSSAEMVCESCPRVGSALRVGLGPREDRDGVKPSDPRFEGETCVRTLKILGWRSWPRLDARYVGVAPGVGARSRARPRFVRILLKTRRLGRAGTPTRMSRAPRGGPQKAALSMSRRHAWRTDRAEVTRQVAGDPDGAQARP